MIYYIEGIMCSGKTTLAKKLEHEAGYIISPEPTPAPFSESTSIVNRQNNIFNTYIEHFDHLIDSSTSFLCDYSPFGVLPFELALSEWSLLQGNTDDYINLHRAAIAHQSFLNQKKKQWGDSCIQLGYLTIEEDVIIKRLQQRNRTGDSDWPCDFIKILKHKYDWYFINGQQVE